MRIINFFFIIIIIVISSLNSYGLGKAVSMGNIQTVVPGGPFDTARNPALISFQTSANSTGLFCTYIMHFFANDSIEQEQYINDPNVPFQNSIDSDTDNKDPDITGMSCHIANSTKSGNFAIGFTLTDNGNDQYLITEKDTIQKMYGTDSYNGTLLYSNTDETIKTTEINPAFITSLGFNLSNESSIGFQLIAGFSDRIEEKDTYVEQYAGTSPIPASIPAFKENKKSEIKKYSGEIGFGYLYNKKDQQIGIILKTGELSFIEKKLKTQTETIYPTADLQSANSSLKMKGVYTASPAIIAGVYNRINSYFAFACESAVRFENNYTDDELELNKETDYSISDKEAAVKTENIYSFKGGIELNPSNKYTLTFGTSFTTGGFYRFEGSYSEDSGRKVRANMDIRYLASTFGFQYAFSKSVTFDIISALILYKEKLHFNLREKDESTGNSIEVDSKEIIKGMYVHTGFGVTFNF